MAFFKRNFGVILIITLLSTLFALFWSFYRTQQSYHAVLFTAIANSSASDAQSKEQASTYFGETIMGWFRNPVFLNKILTENNLQGSLTAHKQERQNLIIEIDANTSQTSMQIAEKTFQALEKEIGSFNQKNKSQFTILNLGVSTSPNPLKRTILILIGIGGGISLSIFLVIVWEALRSRVSFGSQVKEFFQTTAINQICFKNKEDLDFVALQALHSSEPVILAGADFDHSDLTVQVAMQISEIDKNMILVDADLKEKKLHHNLGLSNLMQDLKGLTDRLQREEKLAQYIHQSLDKKFHFLAAGKGENIILDDLSEQLSAHKTILLHTTFPQNFPVLNLQDFTLFLFVKLGKSRLSTLQKLKSLNLKNIRIFIV